MESQKNAPTEGIILGWRYREKYKDKTKISCVDGDVPILGFTKKNSVWLSHEVAGWNMPELSALVDTGYMCFDVCGKQDDPSSQRWYCLKNSTDYPKFKKTGDYGCCISNVGIYFSGKRTQ